MRGLNLFNNDAYSFILFRALTAEEKAAENAAKRKAQFDAEDMAVANAWQSIDANKECFRIDQYAPNDQFLVLKKRGAAVTSLDLFTSFITPHIVERLLHDFPADSLVLGVNNRSGNPRYFKLTSSIIWQAIAVQIRIIGRQNIAGENNPLPRNLTYNVNEARNHFATLGFGTAANREVIERVIARAVMTESYSSELSDNFLSAIRSLGQYVAGDEKLFHFTGNSQNVRLVISKPDRVGFWFYELAGRFANNLPYMLNIFMHNSTIESVKVSTVVGRWVAAIKAIPDRNKCILAMDSYYMDASVKEMLLGTDIKFTASVKADRMKSLVRAVRPTSAGDSTMGEWKGLFNKNTGETFVYHFDTQKGVGIKYNYARGFVRSQAVSLVKEHKHRIPVYDYYKTFFEVCDRYNRNLHDKAWPHKRGGRDLQGEDGHHHDFLMACVLQNVRNACVTARGVSLSDETFQQFCDLLADQLFQHAMAT